MQMVAVNSLLLGISLDDINLSLLEKYILATEFSDWSF